MCKFYCHGPVIQTTVTFEIIVIFSFNFQNMLLNLSCLACENLDLKLPHVTQYHTTLHFLLGLYFDPPAQLLMMSAG